MYSAARLSVYVICTCTTEKMTCQSYDKLESQTEVVAIPRQDHKTVHVVDHCCSLAVDGDGAVGVFALVVAHRVLVLYM